VLALQIGIARRRLQALVHVRKTIRLGRFALGLVLRRFAGFLLARQLDGESGELLMTDLP